MAAPKSKPKEKQRQLHVQPYRSFRLSKRVKPTTHKLPNVITLFHTSLHQLRTYWRPFLGIVLVYLVLNIVMVKGFGVSMGIEEAKTALQDAFGGTTAQLSTGATLFAGLLAANGATSSEVAGLYQSVLVVLVSLAVIWGLRQSYAGNKITSKQAFYQGMYPLVPFLLVMTVIGLQLLPMLTGLWIYNIVIAGGVAVLSIEKAVVIIFTLLLALLSLYMVASSLFALYIVTLPEMTPMKALRSAREIVQHRRWIVLRKILALPVLLVLVGGIIVIPLIMFVTPLAEWVFFILNMTALAVMHSYMYSLYRELL